MVKKVKKCLGKKRVLRKQAPALTKRTWELWLKFVLANAKPQIFFVLWLTGALGLRCGEAVALRREDFQLDAEEPYVRAAGHIKGAKKSPGYVHMGRAEWRFLNRTLAKGGLRATRQVGIKHGKHDREEEYTPLAKGYLFRARSGSE